ncbi:hypothetical protein PROFUN_08701 [Planoprotostelium fungivorum]|uniref:Rab-GAP TBC domain-containing protein n=1 Tax=Planoprotostelium fungivorum TaxID=1890364 RepID=A0A2P6MQV0_9EUKA|nr:hypothetical protein PROFUN_08701 [Planoprotostelium fungivorum]
MTDFITDVFTKISRIKKAPIFLPSSPVSVVSPREPVPTLPPRPVISAPEPTVEVSAPKMEEKIPSIVLRKVPTPKVRVLHPGTPKSRERATKRSAPAQSTDPIQQILENLKCGHSTVRGQIWLLRMKASRGQSQLREDERRYEKLLLEDIPDDISEQIQKDLSRTYPQYELFQSKEVQAKMFNILRAVAAFFPSLGYLQGMGYVAAFLITMMPEEDAFWFMVHLIHNFGMEDFWGGSLPALPKSFYILEKLMQSGLPALYNHLTSRDIQTSSYATPWMVTIFLSNHSLPFAMRLWDMILFMGFKYVYTVAMAIFTLYEREMLSMGFDDILSFLQFSMKEIGHEPDVEEVLRVCSRINDRVQTNVDRFDRQYEASKEERRAL